jgi:hypothetical protein
MGASHVPMNPFDSLLWRARNLRQRLSTSRIQSRNPGGNVVLDFGISTLVPHGLKGMARGYLGRASATARQRAEDQSHQEVDQLVSEARSLATRYSIPSSKLGPSGNSHRLLGKLGPSLDSGSSAARAARLERALDFLSKTEMIENQEIPALLRSREYHRTSSQILSANPELSLFAAKSPQSTGIGVLRASIGELGLTRAVNEPLIGALRSLEQGGPDAYRQGLNSLRVALDAFIEAKGGKGAWNSVGRTLVQSDEEWKVIAAYHHVLSMGSHHGRDHPSSELQIALEFFTPACKLLSTPGVSTQAPGNSQ